MIPVFSSHHSLQRSILTADKIPDDWQDIDCTGTVSIFEIAKKYELKQLIVAEDSFSGFYEQYIISQKENVQLIYGVNFTIVNDINSEDNSNSIITLWIKNSSGYEDILRINQFANNEGYKNGVARLDWKNLNGLLTTNLLVTIPFYNGFLAKNLMSFGANCIPIIEDYNPIFLINEQGLPFDTALKNEIVKFCKQNYYDYLPSHNIYYYKNEHSTALQILRCIGERSSFEKPELPHFSSDQFSFENYLSKPDRDDKQTEFTKHFEPYKLDKLTRGIRIPEFVVSEEEKKRLGLEPEADNFTYLCQLTGLGLYEKVLQDPKKKPLYDEYVQRCKTELDILKQTSLVDYILIVADTINFARREGIPVGRSRGSVSGSLVCWLIGVTEVDSLEYKLYFTRFISEARVKTNVIDGVTYLTGGCADVDSDFSYLRRQEVIDYVYNKYKGKTAKIGTVSTLTGKSCIKEIVKAKLNYSEAEAQYVSDMIDRLQGTVLPLASVYKNNPEFKRWVDSSSETTTCYHTSLHLENLISHRGQHASGIAVSYDDINTLIPIARGVDAEGEEYFATAYDMEAIGNILLKLDILGLKTLDIIDEVLKRIGKTSNQIDVHDPCIYKLMTDTDNYCGLFQIEGGVGKTVVLKIRPKNLSQLAICISVNRPGALKFIDDYVKYNETGEVKSIYPSIDEILKETGGVLVYQEQVNQVCQEVYQMKATDAEEVRRALAKKKREDMMKWEPVLYSKGNELGIPPEVTKYFWGVCDASSDYLFSKNHAIPYSQITAIDCYLKTNYPVEFYTALLNMAAQKSDPSTVIGMIYRELQRVGIKLLPLSLEKSKVEFTIEGNDIRYGFLAAKGIGRAAIDKILSFNRKYVSKFEFFDNVIAGGLDLRICNALIQAGVFPIFKNSRAKLLLEFQTYKLLKDKERLLVHRFAQQFEDELFGILKYLAANKDVDGKEYIKPSRVKTIKSDYENYKKIYLFNRQHGKILDYLMERAVLSYSYSDNLSDIFRAEYPEVKSIHEAVSDVTGAKNTVVGIVKRTKDKISKNKNAYLEMELVDDKDEILFRIFNKSIHFFKDEKGKNPEDNTIVIIRGTKMDGGVYFGEWGKVLHGIKLAKKISDVKE
jgi:DNA polymerase-3 subunit alpha